jgi:hypothetical protein
MGPLSAGRILSTVPVAVLFSLLQRDLIHGLTAGAVNGQGGSPSVARVGIEFAALSE